MSALLLVAAILLAGLLLLPIVIRRAYRVPRVLERGTPADFGLPFRSASIPTANGKRLFAWYVPLEGQAAKARAVAVIHGWGGNAEAMLPFAALLHHNGYAALLLDARNHGFSDADSFSSMPRFAEDLENGLQWLARRPDVDPQRLSVLGHSVGGAAALLTASRRNNLAAVISIAAFAHPVDLMRRQMRSHRIPYVPIGWLVLRYIEWTIDARFDDIAPCNTIRRVACPVLLVHGETDCEVPLEDVHRIHSNRPNDRVELIILPDTGHNSLDAIETHGEALTGFLNRAMNRSNGPAAPSTAG